LTDLTPKQEKFAQLLEEGMNQSDAYRKAYNAEKMTDKTICEKASILASNGKIRARREEIRAPVLDKVGYSIEAHLERLEILSSMASKAGQFTAAVNAETNRGKCSGFYVEKVDVTTKGESIAPTIIEIVAPSMVDGKVHDDKS